MLRIESTRELSMSETRGLIGGGGGGTDDEYPYHYLGMGELSGTLLSVVITDPATESVGGCITDIALCFTPFVAIKIIKGLSKGRKVAKAAKAANKANK